MSTARAMPALLGLMLLTRADCNKNSTSNPAGAKSYPLPGASGVVTLGETGSVDIKTDGSPECYAVDAAHGVFYTNLEDKNRTLAIDIKTHAALKSGTALMTA